MANTVTWTSTGVYTTLVTSSQLSGLSTAQGAISGTNSTGNTFQYCQLELQHNTTGALTAGDYFSVYFLSAADGTNYEDGSTTVTPARSADAIIPLRGVTNGSQRVTISNVILPPGAFKTLTFNVTSTAVSTATSVLSYVPYNDQIQTV